LAVCALESGGPSREERANYSAIRARYETFAVYWYHCARTFPDKRKAQYAERAIDLAPKGPFAAECRRILASSLGLDSTDAPSLLSKNEIDTAILGAVDSDNPALLAPLFPLIGLSDNPYTLYASGALRSLARYDVFSAYFDNRRINAMGRLRERLDYVVQGARG
jgi:hypothetical protein